MNFFQTSANWKAEKGLKDYMTTQAFVFVFLLQVAKPQLVIVTTGGIQNT